jgi:hypothetical protein
MNPQNYSLYIPRAFPNITKKRITDEFSQSVGNVKQDAEEDDAEEDDEEIMEEIKQYKEAKAEYIGL